MHDRKKVQSVDAAAREMTAQLRRMADPARARGAHKYFKEQIVALGITAPVLRFLVRERTRLWRAHWTAADAIAFCDQLLEEPEMEVRGAGFLALAAFNKGLSPELLSSAERWLQTRLDNWALVDGFCSAVLSPLLDRHPSVERQLEVWSRAESLWLRRAALVTLVPFVRRGRLLDKAYRLARAHFRDPEDLMHKATGWLLREAGKTDMPRLRQFLIKHGPAIARTTVRYAIERFSPSEREFLLYATRASADNG